MLRERAAAAESIAMNCKQTARRLAGLAVAVALTAGCAGLTAGRLGSLRLSSAAAQAFESATVLPDHNYFYSGPDMKPFAIIAIHEDYALETKRWKPVQVTPKLLKDWIDQLTGYLGYGLRTYGSEIVGPEGEYIGIWYSKKENSTTVRLLEGNRVMVYPPNVSSTVREPFMLSPRIR
jgi:hypothetical protein